MGVQQKQQFQSFNEIQDPTFAGLVDRIGVDWGNAEAYTKQLIKYRVGPEFDAALWGINVEVDTELITIQAPAKQRKSTHLANLLLNFSSQLLEKKKYACLHTLEPGMNARDYRDVMLSMMAVRLLITEEYGDDRTKWPDADEVCAQKAFKVDNKNLLHITRKFLRAGERHPRQQKVIDQALRIGRNLPLSIFGPGKHEGQSRNLDRVLSAWELLYEGKFPGLEGKEHRIFALDHIQQISGFANSYQLLMECVPRISDFIVGHPGACGIVLSQVSLTSQRAAENGDSQMDAAGGKKLAEESNTVFQTEYDPDKDPFHLLLSTPYSRYEPPPKMRVPMEPFSGVYLGMAKPTKR